MKDEVIHGGAERLSIRYANDTPGAVRISRYKVGPGSEVSLHVHTGKMESWVIVRGAGRALVAGVEIDVEEGDVIATPPGSPHSLRNTGSTDLVFINVVQVTEDGPISTTELT